jgi:hypothetical protein
MNSPVILAIPVLMLLDYQLMIMGAKASLGVYRQHYTTPHLQLNPFWQKRDQQLRRFNPRHFVIVCIVTALLVLLDRWQNDSDLLVGMLLGAGGSICGRHLSNFLLFHHLNSHPAEIEGHVHLAHQLALKMSFFNFIGLVPLLGLIAVLVPQPQVIGALLGILSLAFAQLVWARKAKSQEVKALEAAAS